MFGGSPPRAPPVPRAPPPRSGPPMAPPIGMGGPPPPAVSAAPPITSGRKGLLSDITKFKKNHLKKTETVDKSVPMTSGGSHSGSGGGGATGAVPPVRLPMPPMGMRAGLRGAPPPIMALRVPPTRTPPAPSARAQPPPRMPPPPVTMSPASAVSAIPPSASPPRASPRLPPRKTLPMAQPEASPSGVDIVGINLAATQWRDISHIVDHMMQNGAATEPEIFRTSASVDRVKQLMDIMATGQGYSANLGAYDLHTHGSVLRKILRAKDPLIPYDLFPILLDIEPKEFNQIMEQIVTQLPPDNLAMLCKLLDLLVAISQNRDITLVDSALLAYFFGPCLMRPRQETPEFMMLLKRINGIVQNLIDRRQLLPMSSAGVTAVGAGFMAAPPARAVPMPPPTRMSSSPPSSSPPAVAASPQRAPPPPPRPSRNQSISPTSSPPPAPVSRTAPPPTRVQVPQRTSAAPSRTSPPPIAPPVAPKAPPVAPMAPPAAPVMPSDNAGDRSGLLSSIQSFSKRGLKKTATVDKSAPVVGGGRSGGSGNENGSKSGGGLFPDGVPRLPSRSGPRGVSQPSPTPSGMQSSIPRASWVGRIALHIRKRWKSLLLLLLCIIVLLFAVFWQLVVRQQ